MYVRNSSYFSAAAIPPVDFQRMMTNKIYLMMVVDANVHTVVASISRNPNSILKFKLKLKFILYVESASFIQ